MQAESVIRGSQVNGQLFGVVCAHQEEQISQAVGVRIGEHASDRIGISTPKEIRIKHVRSCIQSPLPVIEQTSYGARCGIPHHDISKTIAIHIGERDKRRGHRGVGHDRHRYRRRGLKAALSITLKNPRRSMIKPGKPACVVVRVD